MFLEGTTLASSRLTRATRMLEAWMDRGMPNTRDWEIVLLPHAVPEVGDGEEVPIRAPEVSVTMRARDFVGVVGNVEIGPLQYVDAIVDRMIKETDIKIWESLGEKKR